MRGDGRRPAVRNDQARPVVMTEERAERKERVGAESLRERGVTREPSIRRYGRALTGRLPFDA